MYLNFLNKYIFLPYFLPLHFLFVTAVFVTVRNCVALDYWRTPIAGPRKNRRLEETQISKRPTFNKTEPYSALPPVHFPSHEFLLELQVTEKCRSGAEVRRYSTFTELSATAYRRWWASTSAGASFAASSIHSAGRSALASLPFLGRRDHWSGSMLSH